MKRNPRYSELDERQLIGNTIVVTEKEKVNEYFIWGMVFEPNWKFTLDCKSDKGDVKIHLDDSQVSRLLKDLPVHDCFFDEEKNWHSMDYSIK